MAFPCARWSYPTLRKHLSSICVAWRSLVAAAAAQGALQRALSTLPEPPTASSSNTSGGTASSSAPLPAVPVQRLQRAITPQVCDHLRRHGFAVIDGVLGEEAAAALRAEVAAVRGHMHKNCTHLVQGGSTSLLEKEHIWEAELMQADTQALAPLCAQMQHDATLRTMLSVLMPELRLHTQAIKLQWNAGRGGCFPMHFDSDMAVDRRRVTAIWYLNPGWKPGDGGELRLYPFPQAAVDVEPLNDRMVLFSSMHLLHRVLPSTAERYCFTIWMSEGGGPGPRQRQALGTGNSNSGGGGGGAAGAGRQQGREEIRRALSSSEPLGREEAWRLLLHPELRKHAAKLYHRAEWEQSIRQSHPAGPALQQALETFSAEVAVIGRALAPLLPALEAGPPPGGAGLPPIPWFG